MMKSLVILCLLAGLVSGQDGESLCQDVGETFSDPSTSCVNCTCVQSLSSSMVGYWSCEQTCQECPASIVSRICLINFCNAQVSCPAYPNAECIMTTCDTCEFGWFKDGEEVNCTVKAGECPMPPPDDGSCLQPCDNDLECEGNRKCCPSACGKSCSPPVLNACQNDPCENGGSCFTGHDNPLFYVCDCPDGFTGARCEIESDMGMHRNPCPDDRPFMNCTYDEVCSAPCTGVPSARCLMDHCGGCTPVYLTDVGHRMDCETGTVLECPDGVEMAPNCSDNPCDSAVCTADLTAKCVFINCGGCFALFVNIQGQHVDCETGDVSVCPRGLVENQATMEEACAMATCPANPWARCMAKRCLYPNTTLECPYKFFDVRARPVQCTRVKRGQCPRIEAPEVGTCPIECTEDGDCDGDEKCCSNACGGRVCHDPDMDMDMDMEEPMSKPGTCPEPSMMDGGICVDDCNPEYGDAGCPRHWKCCHNGCGHVCTAPREMPGQCPMVPDDAGAPDCEQECTSDSDCQMEEPGSKCCSHGCGMRCKTPVRAEKPGTCPMPLIGAGGICVESCMGDDDCPGRGKCCSNGCGHTCMDPMEQPGECPFMPNHMMLLASPQQACTADSDCSGRRSKCCAYGCGQICVEPVTVEKPGTCPMPVPDEGGICAEMCSGDEDCSDTKKCCSNSCGRTCMEPVDKKPGMCPMIPPDVAGICVELCGFDQPCPGDMKCCSNGCGHTCMEPIMTKPGMCPAAPPGIANNCPPGQMHCSDDMGCPGQKKCCEAGCEGRICLAPVPKAGECPAVPDDVGGACVHQCSANSDCRRGQKCCFNGCGYVCERPGPIQCDEEVLPEICLLDPCQHASCPNEPDAVCVPDVCGRCEPKFFVNSEEVKCIGQEAFCPGMGGGDGRFKAGTTKDSQDGCNLCICTGQGLWRCSERECGEVFQVSVTLNASFDNIINNSLRFIGKMKKVMSERFGLPANAMRDFKFRKGSVIVDFKVSSDGTEGIDLDGAIDMMKTEVAMGTFSFEFEGEAITAKTDSFKSNPYDPTPPSETPPPRKDKIVYIAIGVIGGVVIIVVIISLISCSVKSRRAKARKTKSENLEFNEYHIDSDSKPFKA